MCKTRPTKIRMSVSQLYPMLRMMHKKLPLNDTSATCPECAPIRFVRYKPIHITLLGLMPTQHESEKHGEKHGFGVICVTLLKGPGTKMCSSVIQL